MMKHIPSKDWNWEKETQSRILMQLDIISCQLSNMFRKKGTKPRKPADQFQPDYVKDAKIQAKTHKKEQNIEAKKDLEEIFQRHNSKINQLEKQ